LESLAPLVQMDENLRKRVDALRENWACNLGFSIPGSNPWQQSLAATIF